MGKPVTQDRKEKEDKNEKEGLKKDMRKQKGQTIANKNPVRMGKRTENKGTTRMKNKTEKPQKIKCACWNVRRGLIKQELEVKNILQDEKIDIMFLVEVDTNLIKIKTDFILAGYETVVQKRKSDEEKVRVVWVFKEELSSEIKVREDLMSNEFPSIWLEVKQNTGKNLLVGGYYREWSKNGKKSEKEQVESIKVLVEQMEKATNEKKTVVMLGDMNINAEKWRDEKSRNKKVASEILGALEACGLKHMKLGCTFLADNTAQRGRTVESELDHIYITKEKENNITVKKGETSATDHLPIMAELEVKRERKEKARTIYKRSMKNFNSQDWNRCLAGKNWEELGRTEDVNEMAELFSREVNEALDICAPVKKFTIRQNHKFGITENTKKLIKERDKKRKQLKDAPESERELRQKEYKKLRNSVTNRIREDNKKSNDERIEKANDENEIWKVINEVTNPKKEETWKLKEGEETIEDEEKIAEIFNKYFVDKIENLKDNIDQEYVKNPTEKLKEKMKEKNLKFSLKTVTEKQVLEAMKGMKKKKSAGVDGVTQEQLIMGSEVLVVPLTRIINASIQEGEFPEMWKTALMTPILKKGSPEKKENYRPVSCLSVASKVAEKIVCDQVTKFFEKNKLLPENQHGFRAKRSTMTALSALQKEWVENLEEGMKTGVVMWDLSAAYDTLNINILLEKLQVYGFDGISCKWFASFLKGRTQQVKIGRKISTERLLVSGVPQGGILSPIIFTIYGADLELWTKDSSLTAYADDTTTGCKDKEIEGVVRKVEEDARRILEFMASNGLVANPTKTTFLVLNHKAEEEKVRVRIGDCDIEQESTAKLLGIQIDDDLEWTSHSQSLKSALNQRTSVIRRMKNHLSGPKIKKIVDSIWTSKLRYGLQLCASVRTTEDQWKTQQMKGIQMAQNRMLRTVENKRIRDKVSIESMLVKNKMLSVNQTNAQIKLTEMWKMENDEEYPVKGERQTAPENGRETRGCTSGKWIEFGVSSKAKASFLGDAIRLWNKAPEKLKVAKTINGAKKDIKKFCMTLPV